MAKYGNRKSRGQSGCLFLLSTGIILVALLLSNIWIVRTFGRETILGVDARLFQASQFILPILMIFAELWIYDRLVGRKRIKDNGNT